MLRFSMIGLGVLLASQGVALAQQSPAAAAKNQCFFVRQFENWKSSADEKTLYIRFGTNRFYRLGLAARCVDVSEPDVALVSKFRGDTICSAQDFDFQVRRSGVGITTPCIVRSMTPMTPAEVAALPAKEKP